ncbi:MAG: 2-oxo-4-hydroxy-4-carboxy-5-ureidoimidazoline decarboxylase, partial [Polyangiales bacterium]
MNEDGARTALTRCCGSAKWVDAMLASRPFADDDAVFTRADDAWATMERADILEAFTHHPRIGSSIEALR